MILVEQRIYSEFMCSSHVENEFDFKVYNNRIKLMELACERIVFRLHHNLTIK